MGSSIKNKNVFITGADGFIGSHVCDLLVKEGAKVTALAQYNSFDHCGWLDDLTPDVLNETQIIRGDIRDAGQMRRAIKGQDLVLHLAALIAIPYSYHAPQSYVDVNVTGTTNILEAARDYDVGRVVVTSTSEVYGTAQYTPMDEAHPLQGQSPYAASKIAADMMAVSYYRSFGLPTVILRPFNTYGPRQSERAVISTIIRQILDDNSAHIELGSLAPKRDFTFVEDTAKAFLAATTSDDIVFATPYNAGNGKSVSIGELVDILKQIAGSTKEVVQRDERLRPEKSEVMNLECNASLFKSSIGWSPETSLVEGLQKTFDWHRAFRKKSSGGYMI